MYIYLVFEITSGVYLKCYLQETGASLMLSGVHLKCYLQYLIKRVQHRFGGMRGESKNGGGDAG